MRTRSFLLLPNRDWKYSAESVRRGLFYVTFCVILTLNINIINTLQDEILPLRTCITVESDSDGVTVFTAVIVIDWKKCGGRVRIAPFK